MGNGLIDLLMRITFPKKLNQCCITALGFGTHVGITCITLSVGKVIPLTVFLAQEKNNK